MTKLLLNRIYLECWNYLTVEGLLKAPGKEALVNFMSEEETPGPEGGEGSGEVSVSSPVVAPWGPMPCDTGGFGVGSEGCGAAWGLL